jgi:hypothetical protein
MTSEQIKDAMLNFKPVKYKGITFKRITAYIFRVVETTQGKYKTVMQCELLDKNNTSVVIAESEKVELIENG